MPDRYPVTSPRNHLSTNETKSPPRDIDLNSYLKDKYKKKIPHSEFTMKFKEVRVK